MVDFHRQAGSYQSRSGLANQLRVDDGEHQPLLLLLLQRIHNIDDPSAVASPSAHLNPQMVAEAREKFDRYDEVKLTALRSFFLHPSLYCLSASNVHTLHYARCVLAAATSSRSLLSISVARPRHDKHAE